KSIPAATQAALNMKSYTKHIRHVVKLHDEALQHGGFDNVVIYSGGQHFQFLDDRPYPFSVNPLFKYWCPLTNQPDCFIVHQPGEKPVLLFYQPVDYWHLVKPLPDAFWVSYFDVRVVSQFSEAKEIVAKLPGRTAFLCEWNKQFDSWKTLEGNPQGLLDYLHFYRAYKTPYEIECTRGASKLGAKAHHAAAQAFRDGASEYEINLAYCSSIQHTEHELPYSNIVALNQHAATLHYQWLDRDAPPVNERHSFLIDAGASYNGYASDITRTYSYQDTEFQELIDAMDAMQQRLCAGVVHNHKFTALHETTHHEIAKILSTFNFVNASVDEIVETGISRTFYPHGLGHFLGLQVHDVGGHLVDAFGTTAPPPAHFPHLRQTRKLEDAQLITIEPGLYFIDSLLAELNQSENSGKINWAKIEQFKKFGGVRIEDNVVVNGDTPINLTREAFSNV
ncbi:MAG: Xaa-Pro dipeptidase, partial [Gammaproteobacteria bacterium]|nr:Xaa-Pro dipeptidase [Gammaproteobacteria bacterium]